MICPKCKADRAHRSHRRGPWEHVAGFFAFYPYRCHACQARFIRFRYAGEPFGEGGPNSTEREIRATRTRLRWKKKKREFLLYAIGLLLFLVALYFITRPYTPAD